ncbi:hypothetical protein N7539_009207 [Penicillium diatomitis]|uniref:Uncharacterized protein n=1 Tax=Penicillium diatomitis TaxID=2819901 RepID=A0A9W9WLB3_9EURO|nr:uncharacterized protein N7539_009207 [Penicillium diatomitis]KAJ5469589.1 hypothetical protein N7539_009207 [Penicillium diatomitis]
MHSIEVLALFLALTRLRGSFPSLWGSGMLFNFTIYINDDDKKLAQVIAQEVMSMIKLQRTRQVQHPVQQDLAKFYVLANVSEILRQPFDR